MPRFRKVVVAAKIKLKCSQPECSRAEKALALNGFNKRI
jgi:hypothetical protein